MVEPTAAWQMMQADKAVLMVDVRSDMEYLMIGHPKGALNAPWSDQPDGVANPRFVSMVRKLMLGRVSGPAQKSVSLLLICRSGKRSVDAATLLLAEGVENVHVVSGGFEGPLDHNRQRSTGAGWRYAGLPWEQC